MGNNSNPTNPEELVEYIASWLVEIQDKINVESYEEDNKTIIRLTVDESDKGKIIGKNGKVAKSIRNVLKLASTKKNTIIMLEIL